MASIPVAAIAADGDITNILVTGTEAHQTMASDYTLAFDLDRAIIDVDSVTDGFQADGVITVDFGASDFNCDNLDSMDVNVIQFKVDGSDFDQAAKVWDSTNHVLTITPQAEIALGSTISIEFNDIIVNPTEAGDKYFATLRLIDKDGIALCQKLVHEQVKFLSLAMMAVDEADIHNDETQVNIRKKIKIELKDDDGLLAAKEDITGYLYGQGTSFYTAPADETSNATFTIPAGESSAELYFVADNPGIYTISMDLDWSSIYIPFISDSIEINVTPAEKIDYGWDFAKEDIIAGETGKIDIWVLDGDQYGNVVDRTEPITLDLQAINFYNGEVSETAAFFAADEDDNLVEPKQSIASVTIPANEYMATFYYTDTHATVNDPLYNLDIQASYGEDVLDMSPVVYPAESTGIFLKTVPETDDGSMMRSTTGVNVEIQAELQDEYGNKANPQPDQLTLNLSSDSNTGEFLDGEYGNVISQVTFLANDDFKTFYYQDTTPGTYTITASTTDLEDGTVQVEVIDAPQIGITLENNPVEIYLNNKVTLDLKYADGTAYLDHEDIMVELSSYLMDDEGSYDIQAGLFYPNKADNDYSIEYVTVPAGQSSVDVYYCANLVGEHFIEAYAQCDEFDISLWTESESLTVTAAQQVQNELTVETDEFIAGEPGKVTVEIQDQYWNPVVQGEGGLTVGLEAKCYPDGVGEGEIVYDEDAEPVEGAFYATLDGNGDVSGEPITEITIPEGESSISFYYMDTKSTNDPEYNVWLGVEAGMLREVAEYVWIDEIYVLPAAASQLMTTAIDEDEAVVDAPYVLQGRPIVLKVELLDEYGNKANPQEELLTVNLVSSTDTGVFYDEWFWDEHPSVSQITFGYDWWNDSEDQDEEQEPYFIYYLDTEPGTVQVSAQDLNLTHNELSIDVLEAPTCIKLDDAGADWTINQRSKVTISLFSDEAGMVPYSVPAALEEGLDLYLWAEDDGEFYTEQIGGDYIDYYWDEPLVVSAGENSIDVYYEPWFVGEETIYAGYNAIECYTEGELLIEDVKPATGVYVVFDSEEELQFTAGQPGEVHLKVLDQEDNPVKTGEVEVELFAKTVSISMLGGFKEQDATGEFYAALGENGQPVGDPVTQITITNGEATVYYLDDKVTGVDGITGNAYYLGLGVKSPVVNGDMIGAIVNPGVSRELGIKVYEMPIYPLERIDCAEDDRYVMKGNIAGDSLLNETDDVAAGTPFPVVLAIQDENGNPVTQTTPITINLSTELDEGVTPETVYGRFYFDREGSEPATQVTIDEGDQETGPLWLIASGAGQITLQAEVAGIAQPITKVIQVHQANKAEIHFPLTLGIDPYEELDLYETNLFDLMLEDQKIGPEDRKVMYVIATDGLGEIGHPGIVSEDMVVNLEGAVFHDHDSRYSPITTVTIPKGYEGVRVFYEANALEGTMDMTATVADTQVTDTEAVEIVQEPYYTKFLQRGWNVISAPVQLGKSTIADIVHDADRIVDVAYAYNAETKLWEQAGPESALDPMDVVFVKLKGSSYAKFYPALNPSGPYTRNLATGWNLIGPSLDMNNVYEEDYEPWSMESQSFIPYFDDTYGRSLDFVLESIQGKYSRVISPQIGEQYQWAYLPGMDNVPDMGMTQGYWIYMNEPGTMVGYGYTPVAAGLHGHLPYIPGFADILFGMGAAEADVEDAPPLLPAAFCGTVVDQNGNAIDAGTIEAVIDGIVRARMDFTDGEFGLSYGARLIVQSLSSDNIQNITFLVNGMPANESFKLADVTGELVEAKLTVDTSALPLAYNAVQVTPQAQVALTFNKDILGAVDDVKAAITFAADGENYTALGENDVVTIEGNQVIITFANELTGSTNKIKVAASTFKDDSDNVLETAIETAAFGLEDQPSDECFIATAAYGTKFGPAVTLLREFRDQFLMTNELGRQFVNFYYEKSPAVAKTIAGSEFLKLLVRIALAPIVILVFLLFNPVLLVSLMLLVGLGYMSKRRLHVR